MYSYHICVVHISLTGFNVASLLMEHMRLVCFLTSAGKSVMPVSPDVGPFSIFCFVVLHTHTAIISL